MSGHSKWATIKRQKGTNDAKRGQIFTKLSNAITIAVREGGGVTDPASNFKLRIAIDKARSANMPKENIERAIDRAKGNTGNMLAEALYEGFAPGGIAVLVHAVTDNKMRTVAEVKNIFEKGGGAFGSSGSVAYLFDHKGELTISLNDKTSDEVLTAALEANVEDIEEDEKLVYMYVNPQDLALVKGNLEAQGLQIDNAELVYKPKTIMKMENQEIQDKVINFLERLEDISDVQKVFTNANFT